MVKKESKHVGIRIPDSSVWTSFINHVEQKHGKTYGVAGLELQNALKFYLDHPEGANINEMKKKHFEDLQIMEDKINELEINQKSESKQFNQKLDDKKKQHDKLSEQHDRILNQYDKLRNKLDHLQERFNKSQDEVNLLQREIGHLRVAMTKVHGMSLFDRLLNRLPEEIKEIEAPKKEN